MPLVILLYALFASLFSLAKATLNYSEPFFLIGSRMFFAGCLMFLFQLIRSPKSLKVSSQRIYLLVLLGVLNIYLTNIAEIQGLSMMISAKACLIYSLSPFMSALFSFLVFKDTLTKRQWLGLGIGLVGIIPCFPKEVFSTKGAFFSSGEIILLVAVVSSVVGWIILKKLVWEGKEEERCSPITANAYSMMLGGALALLHSYGAGENWNPVPVTDTYNFMQNTLLLCLISNIICYNLYGFLLKRFTATFMSFAGLVTPLFASLFGWLFLSETIGWEFFASFALFSVGLFFFHQDEIKKEGFNIKHEPAVEEPAAA